MSAVILKLNNLAARTECVRCGIVDRPGVPLAAFEEGTWHWVCPECLAAEWDLPEARKALEAASMAFDDAAREKA